MARYIAKNLVAAGLARRVEVQLAYAIGVAEPVSVFVNTFGTGKADDAILAKKVQETFPLTPNGIIDCFELRRPIYAPTSAYGHFGRPEFPWEKTDLADRLAKGA
jgi:S-adenosylmethionine synthetase